MEQGQVWADAAGNHWLIELAGPSVSEHRLRARILERNGRTLLVQTTPGTWTLTDDRRYLDARASAHDAARAAFAAHAESEYCERLTGRAAQFAVRENALVKRVTTYRLGESLMIVIMSVLVNASGMLPKGVLRKKGSLESSQVIAVNGPTAIDYMARAIKEQGT